MQIRGPGTNVAVSIGTMGTILLNAMILSSRSKHSSSKGSHNGSSGVEKTLQGTLNPTSEQRKDLDPHSER